MKRIIQVTDTLNIGGAERVAVDLANCLSALGHEIFFCSTRAGGPLQSDLREGIQFVNLNRRRRLQGIRAFRQYVKKNSISVVHAHGNSTATFCAVALWGMRSVRIIHHDHNSNLRDRSLFVHRFILRRVNAWIAVSAAILDWVRANVKHPNVRLMINPVGVSRFYRHVKKGALPKRLVILANYRTPKDYFNLIGAISTLKPCRTTFTVNAFGGQGDGKYFQAIRNRIDELDLSDVIVLNGMVQDVPKLLTQFDVGVLSSEREGLPVTLLEYMAAYLPVIVTDVGECKRIVEDADCGYVVPASDPLALGKAIQTMLETAQKWDDWGLNGRKFVEQNHSIETFAKYLIDEVY